MGDVENQSEQEREQGGRIDTRFIGKPSGYLGLINMFAAFVSMCMMSGWLGDTRYRSGGYNFFMYACTHTWVALLVIFIIRLIKVPSYCTILNWNITYAINCLVFVILLLISSSMVIKKAVDFRDYCDHYDCNLLTATACFGFITMVGCMIECFFHVKDWKTS